MKEVLEPYIYRYPQLSLPIVKGMSGRQEYLDIVRRGILPECPGNPFIGDSGDKILHIDTPVGEIPVLVLGNRKDFERFVLALGNRCEPKDIMPAVGAMTFWGVSNWRKILAHKAAYQEQGGKSWSQEFRLFTENKENYQDIICVVSRGPYSGVERKEPHWLEDSLNIRIWHEITHIICRKIYPENKQKIRDELVADMIGLLQTYHTYDTELAKRFLGIQEEKVLPEGRLWHYVKETEPEKELVESCVRIICELSQYIESRSWTEVFEILDEVERRKIGLG